MLDTGKGKKPNLGLMQKDTKITGKFLIRGSEKNSLHAKRRERRRERRVKPAEKDGEQLPREV